MAVGLPAKATLDADIFWTVYKSITIHGSYVGNRQDAIECVDIAATGAVKVHYAEKHIDDLEECVFLGKRIRCDFLIIMQRLFGTERRNDCWQNCFSSQLDEE